MLSLDLITASDIQQQLAEHLLRQRKAMKLSRAAMAERSTVPAPTIKHFETTGQISLRQFLLLWQSVDDLNRLADILEQPTTSDFSAELNR